MSVFWRRETPCYRRGLKLNNGRQLRAARALLGWDQPKLAKAARVAIGTVRRMESFEGTIQSHTGTLLRVQTALERGGIEFLDDDRPGVRLRTSIKH
jgi:transcriptional regulator with XRE-family HTH domain